MDKDSIFHKIYNYGSKITQIFIPTTATVRLTKNELDVLDKNVKELENFLIYMGIDCKLTMEKLPDGTKELYLLKKRAYSFNWVNSLF